MIKKDLTIEQVVAELVENGGRKQVQPLTRTHRFRSPGPRDRPWRSGMRVTTKKVAINLDEKPDSRSIENFSITSAGARSSPRNLEMSNNSRVSSDRRRISFADL